MNKKVAIILINYKDYAKKYLTDCIESIRKQDYKGEMKIIIVDNETSNESFQYLSKEVPEAELILNKTNDGFAKGNNDAMRLAIGQGYDYIVLFNMDTIIEKNCVSELVKIAKSDNKIGAVQARLMMWHQSTGSSGQAEKEIINSLGNTMHFLGFGYCLGYKERFKDDDLKIKNIFYPSGAAVLFKREVLEKAGLFDEEFWMYNEDQDLGWRIWLAGFRCVLALEAVVYHKYEFHRSASKYYWLDCNRIIAVVKNYHWLTLILITPACLVMELGLIIFSLKSGWFKEKIKVWKYFFTPKNWVYLWRARRETQRLRKIKDSDIIDMISGRIWYQEIDDVKLRLINPFFAVYWRIVRKVIKFLKL